MKQTAIALAIAFIAFTACNQGSDGGTTTPTPAEQTTPPAQEEAASTTVKQSENPPHGQPGHVHTEAEAATTVTPGTSGEVKLNPPHGEPGHRCDIPVGSPLP
ncbi:MAG TPA: hypothetical protein VNJ07_01075 [Chitinophagales bacterium]|nr:hypothetical protein [Chitinophagales bacterium]